MWGDAQPRVRSLRAAGTGVCAQPRVKPFRAEPWEKIQLIRRIVLKRLYEALVILPRTLGEEDIEGAVSSIRSDVEKIGGVFCGAARIGKRLFARPLGKRQDAGYYLVVECELEGEQVAALRARFKLNEKIFRTQVVLKEETAAPVAEEAAAER